MTKDTFAVFRNRNFAKLFLAATASKFGSVIGTTAFLFFLLHRFAANPAYASWSEAVATLPTLFLFMLVGVVADHFDRQRIAMWSDWIRAALTLVLLVGALLQSVPVMFGALFVRASVGGFFNPAESGLTQGILSADEYTVAAGLDQTQMSLFMLFGTALGAFFYWSLGIVGAIAVDAASFVVSALLLGSCEISAAVRLPNGPPRPGKLAIRPILHDFREGLTYVARHKLLCNVILGFFILGVVNGGFTVIPLFMLKYRLAPNNYEAMFALNGVLGGVAILLGSLIAPWVAKRMQLHQMFIWAFLAGGVLIVAEAFSPNVVVFFAIDFVFSLTVPFVNVPFGGWLPQLVDPSKMGRVDALISPISSVSTVATLGLIGLLFPKVATVGQLFDLVGGCILLVGLYYAWVLPPLVRTQTATEAAAVEL